MSTVTRFSPASVTVRRPARVSTTAWDRPVACITSQPTHRVALPQADTSSPWAFQMRMKASPVGDGSMAISWSQPIPVRRSARARTASAVGRNGVSPRVSTMMKSLPNPFILRNARVMLRHIARRARFCTRTPLRGDRTPGS